jgi:hypothetical protein
MAGREIIQNMTILWISSILGASKPGLSKIYPQTLKKVHQITLSSSVA